MNTSNDSFKKWIPPFIFGIFLIAILNLFQYLPNILSTLGNFFSVLRPFILGAGIAYALNIPCKKIDTLLQKINIKFITKYHRAFSVIITYLFTIFLISLFINSIAPLIGVALADLARSFPAYFENLLESTLHIYDSNNLETLLPSDFDLRSTLSISNVVQTVTSSILAFLRNIVGLSSSFVTLALGIVSSIYYLLFADTIIKFFIRIFYAIFPKKGVDMFLNYARSLNLYFYKYIYCQIIDGIILGTFATIALSIIGIEYAFLFGLMLAILNIIPYFGSIFGTIIVILFALISQGFATALLTTAVLLTIQQLDSNIVQPKLLGSSLKLNPLFIIISISIGGSYYGVLGMIAAIPLATLTRDIVLDIVNYAESKKNK